MPVITKHKIDQETRACNGGMINKITTKSFKSCKEK